MTWKVFCSLRRVSLISLKSLFALFDLLKESLQSPGWVSSISSKSLFNIFKKCILSPQRVTSISFKNVIDLFRESLQSLQRDSSLYHFKVHQSLWRVSSFSFKNMIDLFEESLKTLQKNSLISEFFLLFKQFLLLSSKSVYEESVWSLWRVSSISFNNFIDLF